MTKNLLNARYASAGLNKSVLFIKADEQEIKRLQDLKNQPREWIYRSRVQKVE